MRKKTGATKEDNMNFRGIEILRLDTLYAQPNKYETTITINKLEDKSLKDQITLTINAAITLSPIQIDWGRILLEPREITTDPLTGNIHLIDNNKIIETLEYSTQVEEGQITVNIMGDVNHA